VVAVIGQVERVIGADEYTVGFLKDILALGEQEIAIGVEGHHRVRAASEGKYPALRVHPAFGYRSPAPPGGQRAPVLDQLVYEIAVAYSHWAPPCSKIMFVPLVLIFF
jgi:hypothetical protein